MMVLVAWLEGELPQNAVVDLYRPTNKILPAIFLVGLWLAVWSFHFGSEQGGAFKKLPCTQVMTLEVNIG